MNNHKQQELDSLAQAIISDKVCPELQSQAMSLVFGEGNPGADVVFVGEAPGKKEDEQARPFVGASGRSLDNMLESIGIERSMVYITNIVKYRPLNNRDPKPVEKQAFLPYLLRQIAIIAPKLIVTLGRHSMDVLLPGLKITDVHGQLITTDNGNYLPLYHPAAAMYNSKLRQTLADDFSKIPSILNSIA